MANEQGDVFGSFDDLLSASQQRQEREAKIRRQQAFRWTFFWVAVVAIVSSTAILVAGFSWAALRGGLTGLGFGIGFWFFYRWKFPNKAT